MAEELKTVLGFDASQAISTLAKLSTQLAGYTTSMVAAAGSTTGFNSAAKGVDATLGQLSNAQKGLISSQNDVVVSSKKVKKPLQGVGTAADDTGKKTKKAAKQMMLSWQAVTRIFAIQVIHQAISKVTSALSESISEASSLEIALAEIQTISVPLRDDFESLADSVHDLSDKFGITRDIVAEGIYQTLSNQIADGADAFTFFAASSELAVGGVMSADAAVNLLSSTINAYGYNAAQAATISGKLFKTIELGRVRGEEFANTYGRILVVASQLGVSFDEVSASVATLTISGLKYNQAATLITNTMLKLMRPTDVLKKTMKEMGVASAEAGIQAFGFQGFLQKLRDAAGGSTEALGEMFGRVRAIRGVMGLTNEATERYVENLKKIEEAGAGDIFEAKELIFETNAKQVQIELNALKNVIVFGFGRDTLAVINEVFQAFGGAVNILEGLVATIGTAALGMTIFAAIVFPIPAAILAMSVAIGAVVASIAEVHETNDEKLKKSRQLRKEEIAETNKEAGELAELRIREAAKNFSTIQKYATKRMASMGGIVEDARIKEEYLSGILDQQLDKRRDAWTTFVDAIEQIIVDSVANIETSQKKIFDIESEIARFDFDQSIKGADALKKSAAANKRSANLIREAGEAFRQGKTDVAAEYLGEAKAMARMALASAEAVKNSGAEYQARKQMTAVFDAQLEQQKLYQANEREIARAAQAEHGKEEARAERITALLAALKKTKIFDAAGETVFGTPEQTKTAAKGFRESLEAEFAAARGKMDFFTGLGLEEQLQAAVGLFENLITKEPVSLKFAIDQYIDETFKDLQAFFNQPQNVIEAKIEGTLIKLGWDPTTLKGLEEMQKGLPQQQKDLEKLERGTVATEGKQREYNGAIMDGVTAFANFNMEVTDMKNSFEDFEGKKIILYGLDVTQAKQQLALINTQTEVTRGAMKRMMESVRDGFDTEQFDIAKTQLELYVVNLEKAGLVDLAAPIRAFVKIMKDASLIQAGAKIEATLKKDAETARNAAKEAADAIGPMLGAAADVGAQRIHQAAEREKEDARAVAAEWRITAIAIGGEVGQRRKATERLFGGQLYRADGGFTPRGTDTIPAMLTPGESVINADSTRKFFSQIVAMNAGKTPVYRDTGGTVTNVGDVNITVNGADSPKQTARETMALFRREMRRHTSTF